MDLIRERFGPNMEIAGHPLDEAQKLNLAKVMTEAGYTTANLNYRNQWLAPPDSSTGYSPLFSKVLATIQGLSPEQLQVLKETDAEHMPGHVQSQD